MNEEAKQRARQRGEDIADTIMAMFAPRSGLINWRMPNFLTFVLFAFLLYVSQVPKKDLYFGHVPHDLPSSMVASLVGLMTNKITKFYGYRIEEFQPATALEAKRANEQIKSLATAINSVAAGGAVAMTVKQMADAHPNYGLVVFAVGLAVWVHSGARNLLGLLKDESISVLKS